MTDIISFENRKEQIEKDMIRYEDIKREIAERKNHLDSTHKLGDLVQMEEWDGEMWQNLFEGKITDIADAIDEDPWEVFAVLLPKFRIAQKGETN